MEHRVANLSLAPSGWGKIEWARREMKVLSLLKGRYRESRPFQGITVAACLHLEAKTACLLLALKELGAVVAAAGSNPLSTQDDVCAALAEGGVHVYSRHGMTGKEYTENLRFVVDHHPTVLIDDGCDLVALLHAEYRQLLPSILGGSEETTTGVKRLRAMADEGCLAFPMIAVNDAYSKYLFDNRYGTGQSVMDGVMRTTNLLVAGKTFVVVGYGWCGKGVARRASGLGARVVVVEVDPHRALEAHMDGHRVMDMAGAAAVGDFFVTVTGNRDVIRGDHFLFMKDGAVLANAGHFDVEISIPDLQVQAETVRRDKANIETFEMKDGRRLHLLAEGRLVNLAAGDGHPVEIMDLSFASQLLAALHVKEGNLPEGLHPLPESLDREVALLALEAWGLKLERLTAGQERYMKEWRE
ncbi:MAG: adenosylhomocysteinase [Synergistales bacterium]|nr:adenosylhomocysteinase [Synergistales bacterium]